jgi:hypothetical protein
MTSDRITVPQDMASRMERAYKAWDAAIAEGDTSCLVNLHAPYAEIESP